MVEVHVEPVVHRTVDGVELVADLTRRHVIRLCTCLRSRAVLVRAADEERVESTLTAVASEDIGAQHTADQIAQVRDVVHIGESGGDEDVLLSGDGENLLLLVHSLPLLRGHFGGAGGELFLLALGCVLLRRLRRGLRTGLLDGQHALPDEGGRVLGRIALESRDGRSDENRRETPTRASRTS